MPEQAYDCCPPFDPAPWDGQIHDWQGKLFIKASIPTFFYVPIGFGTVMKRLDQLVRSVGGSLAGNLCLSEHVSRWRMDVYLAVGQEIAGADNVRLTGRFLSKVYEGPFSETARWCYDFEQVAKARGLAVSRWLMWYTTCPRCARKYGRNYVVIFGQAAA
jgi:hypothetical protein